MEVKHTPETLDAFEQEIAQLFNEGKIRAPIHLEGGSEDRLINLFREHVQPEDWVLCTWRSHLKCLLKGVPPEVLKAAILAGKSISLCFPEYKIISSAIVGGICPIAVGLALALQRRNEKGQVFCWVGDMTAESGIFHECSKYTRYFDLPVFWVMEDNGVSTNTPTLEAWGWLDMPACLDYYYSYKNEWPHSGTGSWITF